MAQQQYLKWRIKSLNCVQSSKEDFIKSHQKLKKEIPIWVAVETWDFGCISKYYAMLKQSYQNKIAKKLDISNAKALEKWLEYLNITRNRCAHHSRIWNVPVIGGNMVFLDNTYFTSLGLTSGTPPRIFSVIAIIWYLLKNLAPKSRWLDDVAILIDEHFPKSPSLTYQSMGINPAHEKFIDLFSPTSS